MTKDTTATRKPLHKSRTMTGIAVVSFSQVLQPVADSSAMWQSVLNDVPGAKYFFAITTLLGVGLTAYARFDDWRKHRL